MTRRDTQHVPIRSWASERLPDDVQRSLDQLACAEDVRHIAVMPDVHLARDVCVGTAFATSRLVYPDAIGGDIGCGMSAIALDAYRQDVAPHRAATLHRVFRRVVPIHRQRADAAERLATFLSKPGDLSLPSLQSFAETEGVHQLGTLGTGNHFFELQYDADDRRLWLMVHSGSRGLGQAIRAAHGTCRESGRTRLLSLEVETAAGRAYLQDMRWARRFAAQNRWAMLQAAGTAVEELFGWRILDETLFDCDHNHISEEAHLGGKMFVHRKGAMAACRGEPGIVPGSMATPSFHVIGRGVPEALCSSAHGAGRAMGRSEARSRISRARLLRELADVHVDRRTVGGLREEAPSAYKDIHAVMRAQRKLVRVRRTLLPILTHKGVSR